jgi:glutamate synthase (ferredoxin)
MCHNGEINTLRGNISRMRARKNWWKVLFFGEDIKNVPIILEEGKSDSASMDMVIELLLMTGHASWSHDDGSAGKLGKKHQAMSDD